MGTRGCPPAAWWPPQYTPLHNSLLFLVPESPEIWAFMHNLTTYSKQFTLFIVGFSKLAFSRISFPISLIIQIRNVRAGWPLFHCGYRQYSLSKCCQFLTNSWVEFPSNSSRFLYAHYSCLFQELFLSLWDTLHMPSDSPLKNIQFTGFLSIFTKLHNYHYHLMILSSPQYPLPNSSPWQPSVYFLSLWICLFWTEHINEII